MRNVFNYLLAALCFVDLIVILTNIVTAAKIFFPLNNFLGNVAPWSDALCHIAVSASVFITIAITMERYHAVCSPHTYQIRLINKGHWSILIGNLLPIFLAAILLNIPKIFSLTSIVSLVDIFPDKDIYLRVGIISQVFHPLLSTCIIPVFILVFANLGILKSRRMSQSSQTRLSADITMAKTMMAIVTVFIILNIPKMVLALYEVSTIPDIIDCYERNCLYYLSSRRWVMDIVVRYLVMLNSSVNFIIYCFFGSRFRTSLKEIFFPKEASVSVTIIERQPSEEPNNRSENIPLTRIYRFAEMENFETENEILSTKDTFNIKEDNKRQGSIV